MSNKKRRERKLCSIYWGTDMTEENTIRLMCRIQALVSHSLNDFSYAADCFCPNRKFGQKNYRNDGKAIIYIIEAVKEKLTKEGHTLASGPLKEIETQIDAERFLS